MQAIHAQIAEPTVLATARPQDGAGVMSVGVTRGLAVRMDAGWGAPAARSKVCSTKSSCFAGDSNEPLTCDGTHHIGGGLLDRIEVRPA